MTRGSILIVDDDPRLLHIVAMYLGIEGYDVTTAENGEDGLAQVEARAPDLVILDIMMPGMDGIETCKRIRSNTPTADIPIVMFSALSSDGRHRARPRGGRESPDHQAVQPCRPRVRGQDLLPSGRRLGSLSSRRSDRRGEHHGVLSEVVAQVRWESRREQRLNLRLEPDRRAAQRRRVNVLRHGRMRG